MRIADGNERARRNAVFEAVKGEATMLHHLEATLAIEQFHQGVRSEGWNDRERRQRWTVATDEDQPSLAIAPAAQGWQTEYGRLLCLWQPPRCPLGGSRFVSVPSAYAN